MTSALAGRIRGAAASAASAYHRLVLVVGPIHSGKTAALQEVAERSGWPRLNINLELSQRLLEYTQRKRTLRAARVLSDIVDETGADTVLLDNIEVLFSPDLKQDPLRLLQGLSRNRTIVAAWPGVVDGDSLLYADPSHPEHQRYSKPGVTLVLADGATSAEEGQGAATGASPAQQEHA